MNIFVPGRLCLLGEHSDWASTYGLYGGYCIAVGTSQGLSATAEQSDHLQITSQLPDGSHKEFVCEWDSEKLSNAAEDRSEFFRHCAGVASILKAKYGLGGMALQISMDLPLGKGVSSSAAVCVLVAKAYDLIYNLGLFIHEIMDIAFKGETMTGSQCGRMDQACVYGHTPVLLAFKEQVIVEPFAASGQIPLFFVDLGGEKDTREILSDLRKSYAHSPKLIDALGKDNEWIVRKGYKAIRAGDGQSLGEVMVEAQEIFDARVAPYSDHLESPLLHRLLNCEQLKPYVWGGKGVGSQGDGTAQFVAKSTSFRDIAIQIVRSHFAMKAYPLTLGYK